MARHNPHDYYIPISNQPDAQEAEAPVLTEAGTELLLGERPPSQTLVDPRLQSILFDWLHLVLCEIGVLSGTREFDWIFNQRQIFHATIIYFNRVTSTQLKPNNQLQLVLATCLMIANKYYGRRFIMEPSKYAEIISGSSATVKNINSKKDEIIREEGELLSALEFKLRVLTPESVLAELLDTVITTTDELKSVMELLLDAAVFYNDLRSFHPFVLATAFIITVLKANQALEQSDPLSQSLLCNTILSYVLTQNESNHPHRAALIQNMDLCVNLLATRINTRHFKNLLRNSVVKNRIEYSIAPQSEVTLFDRLFNTGIQANRENHAPRNPNTEPQTTAVTEQRPPKRNRTEAMGTQTTTTEQVRSGTVKRQRLTTGEPPATDFRTPPTFFATTCRTDRPRRMSIDGETTPLSKIHSI